jgi:7,8-didemethyl-8-hydroxy-5-deazariboflavin synthase CofH subunit
MSDILLALNRSTEFSLEHNLAGARSEIRSILERVLEGKELSVPEGTVLLSCAEAELPAVAAAANHIRRQRSGDGVSFVITRNINFTNVCYMGCRFCGFAQRRESTGAYWLELDEVAHRAQVAHDRGATEVCIQGGLHPELPATYYQELVSAVKRQVPDMHVHAFSPFEIWFGAHKRRVTPRAFLTDLKDAGLGSIPGTAAEILDVEIRRQLTRNKLTTEAWVDTVRAAHEVGLRSTSTMMYGHIDAPRHWAAHMGLLRDIQKDTGGFTEFVPLGFVHAEAPLYVDKAIPGVRPGATLSEHIKVHAVARLMLTGWIDNIQVSWVKLGPRVAQALLNAGVNDLGGTLMDETISRSAGADFGEELTPAEMVRLIRTAGRPALRRGTLYQVLETFDDHDPEDLGPLKRRKAQPIRFLDTRRVSPQVARHA